MIKRKEKKTEGKKERKPLTRRAKIFIIVLCLAIACAILTTVLTIHQRTGGNLELFGKKLDIRESELFRDVDTKKITKAEIYMNAGTLKGQTIKFTKEDNAEELKDVIRTFFRSKNRYGSATTTNLDKSNYIYQVTFTAGDQTIKFWYYNNYTLKIQGGYYYQTPSIDNEKLNDYLDRYNAKEQYHYFP